MLDFPRLIATDLLIHFPDPNACCHRHRHRYVIWKACDLPHDICPIIPNRWVMRKKAHQIERGRLDQNNKTQLLYAAC
jgi:hypothetical protein